MIKNTVSQVLIITSLTCIEVQLTKFYAAQQEFHVHKSGRCKWVLLPPPQLWRIGKFSISHWATTLLRENAF